MKLDIYNHIFPRAYFERMQEVISNKGPIKRWLNIPVLYDVDARLRMMETFGEYQQILSNSMPPIEFIAGPDVTPGLARLVNDGMAELCQQHPGRFPGFIASLPMNNMDATIKEVDRSIRELTACGVQIFSHVNGRPLDEPEFYPLFERMAQLDKPIWLHPARGANHPDYLTEEKSKYEIWWTFGWPYETSAAMARIVFSGIFDKLPNIKIISHHLGAMIPYFEGRVGPGWDQLDTATFGSSAATDCGLAFFGVEICMFASDCPFDPEGGPMYIRETIKILDEIDVTQADRNALYEDNARKLLNLN